VLILLNYKEIEEITKGSWENIYSDFDIDGINHYLPEILKGDLYFPRNTNGWIEHSNENINAIQRAIKQGAIAIVLPYNTKIKTQHPVLKVKELEESFREVALKNSQRSKSIKILVTGSYGKTGFKTQLYSLIKNYKNTFTFLDSANMDFPIYRLLASIQKNSEVTIVEVAVPKHSVAKERAELVNPDIAIITNIGPEHLRQHGGSIENVIENKSRIAYGIKDNGIIIIPDQIEYNTKEKMTQYIKDINPTINILTFGDTSDNDAYVIKKEYTDNYWQVDAQINNKSISFSLPFLEKYAARATLPILLVCDLLNLNLEEVVQQYKEYTHFKSSGNFYKVNHENKSFFLYDQSTRGILNGFKETLELMSTLRTKNSGKKIALFSEFINFNEGSVNEIDVKEFQELIDNSGLEELYTTNLFCEHINILPNKSIWKEHKKKIKDIIPIVMENIKDNDILFVRATEESNAHLLINKILTSAKAVKQYY